MCPDIYLSVLTVFLVAKEVVSRDHLNSTDSTSTLHDADSTVAPIRHRSVCYQPGWAQYRAPPVAFTPENIDPFLCTHIIYAFARIDVNYTITGNEWNAVSNYKKFTNLKYLNPKLKCLLSVGGTTHPTAPFSEMVEKRLTRQQFIGNVISFLRTHNFDGVDINWQFPATKGSPAEDKHRFTLLLQEFSDAFDDEAQLTGHSRLMLSAAVSAGVDGIASSYEVALITRTVDFINLLSFNFHGGWETVTGHHSALYPGDDDNVRLVVDYAVDAWIGKGCPPHKLNLGIATFGKTFNLSGTLNGIGAPADGPASPGIYTKETGTLSYYEICERLTMNDYVRKFDADRKVPYAYNQVEWIGYDDEQSIIYKVEYVKSRGLGGTMVWSMDMDDFKGEFCNKGPWPILSTLRTALDETDENSTSTYAILGVLVAAIFLIIILLLGYWYWCHRKQSRNITTEELNEIAASGTSYNKTIDVTPTDPWEYPRNRFILKEQLGSGAFGAVYKAAAVGILGKDTVTVAVKKLKEPALESARSDFMKEVNLYKMLDSHPNIITMIGCCTKKEPMYLILEYAPHGNLKTHLDLVRTGKDESDSILVTTTIGATTDPSNSNVIMKYAYEIACGMEYLSSKDCVHRDLAARNVLLGDGMVCKLSDFGLAREMSNEQQYEMKSGVLQVFLMLGTLHHDCKVTAIFLAYLQIPHDLSGGRVPIRWMAPESILYNIYTSQSDVWAYAVLLWEIVTLGSHPYPGMTTKDIIEQIQKGHRLDKPSHCSSEMYSLMQNCWNADPSNRPTFYNLKRHLGHMLEAVEGYLDMSDFNETNYIYLRTDVVSASHSETIKNVDNLEDEEFTDRHNGCKQVDTDGQTSLPKAGKVNIDNERTNDRYVPEPTIA